MHVAVVAGIGEDAAARGIRSTWYWIHAVGYGHSVAVAVAVAVTVTVTVTVVMAGFVTS